jgi:hypothetical protein
MHHDAFGPSKCVSDNKFDLTLYFHLFKTKQASINCFWNRKIAWMQ